MTESGQSLGWDLMPHYPVSGPETERLPQVDVITSDQEPELQLVINTDTLQDIRQLPLTYCVV